MYDVGGRNVVIASVPIAIHLFIRPKHEWEAEREIFFPNLVAGVLFWSFDKAKKLFLQNAPRVTVCPYVETDSDTYRIRILSDISLFAHTSDTFGFRIVSRS